MAYSKAEIFRRKMKRHGYNLSAENDKIVITRKASTYVIGILVILILTFAIITTLIIVNPNSFSKLLAYYAVSAVFGLIYILLNRSTKFKKLIISKEKIELDAKKQLSIEIANIEGLTSNVIESISKEMMSEVELTEGFVLIKVKNDRKYSILRLHHEESRILKSEMKYILEVLSEFMGVPVLDERNKT
ncbi:MAG: hypothetical protein JXR53_14560 [Bacteroidales bacterium]|nr:hypothetical protein [Bacteroidales bacterium]